MSLGFSKNPLVDKINKLLKFFAENKKVVGYGFVALLGFSALFGGYFFYRAGVNKRAHKDFLTALNTFNAKVIKTVTDENLGENVFSSEKDKWQAVDEVFNKFYLKNKTAGIAPFFLAYRVEALLNLDKLSQAIDVQMLLLKNIPSRSAAKNYNNIKLALMQIDTNIDERLNTGLDLLKKLAYEQGNIVQDEALYHLGQYYWNIKNFKEAANYWNQLTIKFGKASKNPSPWVDKVVPKLKTITV
ncbi:MAG: hypothetical protein ABIF12_02375 [bacterium]